MKLATRIATLVLAFLVVLGLSVMAWASPAPTTTHKIESQTASGEVAGEWLHVPRSGPGLTGVLVEVEYELWSEGEGWNYNTAVQCAIVFNGWCSVAVSGTTDSSLFAFPEFTLPMDYGPVFSWGVGPAVTLTATYRITDADGLKQFDLPNGNSGFFIDYTYGGGGSAPTCGGFSATWIPRVTLTGDVTYYY